jgi:hypothetical protein
MAPSFALLLRNSCHSEWRQVVVALSLLENPGVTSQNCRVAVLLCGVNQLSGQHLELLGEDASNVLLHLAH